MNHPFGIDPVGPDPALYKIIKIFCNSCVCQLHGMTGIYNTRFFILASQNQYTGPGIEQKAPVINLLHIYGLCERVDPHNIRCNLDFFFFDTHPSLYGVVRNLKLFWKPGVFLYSLPANGSLKALKMLVFFH